MEENMMSTAMASMREGRVTVNMLPSEREGFMRIVAERGGDPHRVLHQEVQRYLVQHELSERAGDPVALNLLRQIQLLREGYNMFEPLPACGDDAVIMQCILGGQWWVEASQTCRLPQESDEAFVRRVIVNMQLSEEQKEKNRQREAIPVHLVLPAALVEQIAQITLQGRGSIEHTLQEAVDVRTAVEGLVRQFVPSSVSWNGKIG